MRVIEPCKSPDEPGLFEVLLDPLPPTWPRAIPVSERLPDRHTFVLAWQPLNDCWAEREWDECVWRTVEGYIVDEKITHWLPLPPKPE